MNNYVPPDWAKANGGLKGFYLETVKGGVIIETITLEDKNHYVIGRMKPISDILLQHQSISRQHAVLQFNNEGTLYIQDLNSTHGTFLNKKKIGKGEFVKVNVGDVISFGESTRIYSVNGPMKLLPKEYDSANLRRLREKAEKREKKNNKLKEQEEQVTWGFKEDAENEYDDNEKKDNDHDIMKQTTPSFLRGIKREKKDNTKDMESAISFINEKERKLYEQLNKKQLKIKNIQKEKDNILAKEISKEDGLTSGQEKTLMNLNNRLVQLEEEVIEIEEKLLCRQNQKSNSNDKSARIEENDYNEEEDEYYDRTKKKKQKINNNITNDKKTTETLTVDSIILKLSAIDIELEKNNIEIEKITNENSKMNLKEDDALEAYMLEMKNNINHESIVLRENKNKELLEKKCYYEKLLKVALPAIPTNVGKNENEKQINKIVDEIVDNNVTSPKVFTAKSSVKDMDLASGDTSLLQSSVYTNNISLKKTEESNEPKFNISNEKIKEKKQLNIIKNKKVHPNKISASYDINQLEDGERIWVPPSDQTGDGRTSLNDKFGY